MPAIRVVDEHLLSPILVYSSSQGVFQNELMLVVEDGLVKEQTENTLTIKGFTFESDLTVSLTNGRTFGRYATGTTIPSTGKTPAEIIQMAITEPINPTVTLTSTNPITSTFGITGSITTSITGSYVINTLGGTPAEVSLQHRTGNAGPWTTLATSKTNPILFDHAFTVGAFYSAVNNYQYIVTDSAGATATETSNITPQAYTSPSISIAITVLSPGEFTNESNSLRERGNVGSIISGTITRNRVNAPISQYSVQYQVNGTGSWTSIPGLDAVVVTNNPSSISIPSTNHNDASLGTASSLLYRVVVVDAYQTSTSASTTITFQYGMFYGPATMSPVLSSDIRALGTKMLVTSGGTTQLNTGNTQTFFTIALPATVSSTDAITSVVDLDSLSADITAQYTNGLTTFNVSDGGGTGISYNVYTMTIATPYISSHRHSIIRA